MLSRPVVDLAPGAGRITPTRLDRSLLLSTGGESNEAAIRMAKLVTGRYEIVGFSPVLARHDGRCGVRHLQRRAARAWSRQSSAHRDPAPLPYRPRSSSDGAYDWRGELDYAFDLIDRQSSGNLAAVLASSRSCQSGGIIDLPVGYMAALKAQVRGRAACC